MINEHLSDKNSLYLWKFLRPDKAIYPKNINNIQLGEIDTTSVCFHTFIKRNLDGRINNPEITLSTNEYDDS